MSEIAYTINPQVSLSQGYLVLDLLEVIKEGYSYQIITHSKERLIPHWRSLAKTPSDQEVFNFLIRKKILCYSVPIMVKLLISIH